MRVRGEGGGGLVAPAEEGSEVEADGAGERMEVGGYGGGRRRQGQWMNTHAATATAP